MALNLSCDHGDVQAGNASYGDSQRTAIADQIAAIRSQLLSVANRPDGNGGYVFSGQGAATSRRTNVVVSRLSSSGDVVVRNTASGTRPGSRPAGPRRTRIRSRRPGRRITWEPSR